MKNKDIFILNPEGNNLINDGVVEINTARDAQGLKIIYHELKTFVCEGEYEKGIYRILDTYLKNFEQPRQPAVWVSGFFGSGKSHLVKMLSYLWEDYQFPSLETARTIKDLPTDVKALLIELDRKQKLNGKLSVSGTLKDFPSNDIRYSFLKLFLSALGLPQQLHHFKFIYWLMQEGIYDEMKALIEAQGKDFRKEYENHLYVSSSLSKAILELKPEYAESEAKVRENFKANFIRVESISRDEFIQSIKQEILPLFYGNKIPCTVIVLDEVQQFIGSDTNRSIDIQNLAQDISSSFDGKFLLVCTGQSALSDTAYLQKLQDRFTVKVSLSDTDVETVTRKTVLEKKASAISEVKKVLDNSMGEISRNLSGTDFATRSSDHNILVSDYPILPSTRKFWKKILQVIDTAGTSGQLRSQLRIIDESVKLVAQKDIGSIVPADFIFEQKQAQLLQNALLLNETNNLVEERKAQGGDAALEGRILSIVFLIDHLPKDTGESVLQSTENVIADLLLDNLVDISDGFRNKIKELVKKLVTEDKVLMPVGEEYKLQTHEGAEWEQVYTAQAVKLNSSDEDQIQRIRREKIISFFRTKSNSINILQGRSQQKREFEVWNEAEKPNTDNKLNLWIRDGWIDNETQVMNEIRAEGTDAPIAYTYVRKQRDADLNKEIIRYLAAKYTVENKGVPNTPEGNQARKSMETRRDNALLAIKDLVDRICGEALILLAGGNKVDQGELVQNMKDALNSIATRQFPDFKKADYPDWDKALNKALASDPEALKKIGWTQDVKDHPVAIDILRFIGTGSKTGRDIRSNFMKAEFGWSQDAIDTILILLKLTDQISTLEPNLNQKTISTATFKKEVHTISTGEKIKLRKFLLDAGINCGPGEEFLKSNDFLNKFKELAAKVSGDSPRPEPFNLQFLKDIENLDGNERLLRILSEQSDLQLKYNDWSEKAKTVAKREPLWTVLIQLSNFAPANEEMEKIRSEMDAIMTDRLLLNEPDLIQHILTQLSEKLKEALNYLKQKYIDLWDKLMKELQTNNYFTKLTFEQKQSILVNNQILAKPEIKSTDASGLLNQLQKTSLDNWITRISALPSQFQSAVEEATLLAIPKAKTFTLPKKTITSKEDLDNYLNELRKELEELLKNGGSIMLK